MRCIYCTEDRPSSSYRKREHVIPQGFGRFSPDNLVLKGSVCDDCNQLFGNDIELFLCRDTFESIERLRHGIVPKEDLRDRKRVKSKVRSGPWKGVIVREKHLPGSRRLGIEKVVQVGFYNNKRDEYDFFEPKDIPQGKELEERGYAVKNAQILLIAEDGQELDTLIGKLNGLGITVSPKTHLNKLERDGEIIPVETEITIDRTTMRGFCKIVFNYLAYVTSRDFVLSPDFDAIRRFIRNNEGKSDHFFAVDVPPILHEDQWLEKIGTKITEGHLVIVGWRGRKVVSKISLFNTNTFGVKLCQNFKGLWRPFNSGHHFDIKTRRVNKLISVSRTLIR